MTEVAQPEKSLISEDAETFRLYDDEANPLHTAVR